VVTFKPGDKKDKHFTEFVQEVEKKLEDTNA